VGPPAERGMRPPRARRLRLAFLLGAITDALALLPMLSPAMASLLWGFDERSGPYRFAMGYAATLMAGWTGLLVWAYQRPIERAVVAVLTALVICGLALTEIVVVVTGGMSAGRMAPTWMLQAALLVVFVRAYRRP
jgi:hypothetical protein